MYEKKKKAQILPGCLKESKDDVYKTKVSNGNNIEKN